MYLANSQDLISLLFDLNLVEFYPHIAIDKPLMKFHHSKLKDGDQKQ